jgi:hypothetical protein
MGLETIEREFKKKVCEEIRIASEGLNRYRIFTPYLFEDGDHLAIVLRKEGGKWLLSDEGHTFMHLTYDMEEKDLYRGTRQKIISTTLATFLVEDRLGELVIPIKEENYGDALFSFVQALLKIADISYLSRERVKSTFMEDFRAFIEERVPEERRFFDWYDKEKDPEGKYQVDCRINKIKRPVLIFALPSDDKVRDATIGLLQFERWGQNFRGLGIFEDQEEINRKVLARFSDVCEKQFSSLASNKDRISRYLEEAMREIS